MQSVTLQPTKWVLSQLGLILKPPHLPRIEERLSKRHSHSQVRAGWLVPFSLRLPAIRPNRQREPPSPTNDSDFVHEQNDYGRQRDPDG